MTNKLPEFYFRTRDTGATVFRVESENRQRRVEMDPIAVVHLRNREIRPQGNRTLSELDVARINDWIDERVAQLKLRETDDVMRAIEAMNSMAHWAQTRASDADLDDLSDRLLMAMHDLRSVLIRRKAKRRSGDLDQGDSQS